MKVLVSCRYCSCVVFSCLPLRRHLTILLTVGDGTFGFPVRRPSEAVESLTDGLGGPSYKWLSGHGDQYNAMPARCVSKLLRIKKPGRNRVSVSRCLSIPTPKAGDSAGTPGSLRTSRLKSSLRHRQSLATTSVRCAQHLPATEILHSTERLRSRELEQRLRVFASVHHLDRRRSATLVDPYEITFLSQRCCWGTFSTAIPRHVCSVATRA